MVQENPQSTAKEPSQKFFRTPVQKTGCRTYQEAKDFATKAFEAVNEGARDIHKAKVFARSNGLFDAFLYVNKAEHDARLEKAMKATPKQMGEAAVKAAKGTKKSHK